MRYDLGCGALLIRGPSYRWSAMGPGSAEQRDRTTRSLSSGARIRATRWRRREYAAPRPGHERNLLSLSCADLPVGRFVDRGVQPPLQKCFGFHPPQITSRTLPIPSHTEGRFAIVTDVGHGMRWTRQRLARDGVAGRVERLVSDHRVCGREMLLRTAKSCGPDAPMLASSLVEGKSALPGADESDIREMTVAKEPGHRGEHDISC
jgi:hypothetical protein